MEYSSLFVKTVDIPNSVNLLTLEQWMKQLNIPQLCDDQDNHSYQYSDKFSGEQFWINLIRNGNNDDIDSFSNNMLIDIKMNARNFEINDGECWAFKSGSHAYVSAKAKIYDIDNMCFKLCNDDGSDELITDHNIVLNCGSLNMIFYHIPNMVIDNLQTGPTIVHIDTGKVYKYRAGVVQSQDDKHIIVQTSIQHLPDASKCKLIFDDNSIVSCCGITNHQQSNSLLIKMVEIPCSINVVTVDQWMKQLNKPQVPVHVDGQEQSAVVHDTTSIKSNERGPMTGEDLRRMEEVKLKLIDGISDPQPICDYLADEGILLPEDKHAIDMGDSPIKKIIKLLNLLIKEYKGSFPVFVKGLKETHHYGLAKLLEDGPESENLVQTLEEDINQSLLVTEEKVATSKQLTVKHVDKKWLNEEREADTITEHTYTIINQYVYIVFLFNVNLPDIFRDNCAQACGTELIVKYLPNLLWQTFSPN
ncbi:uncharacterized protein LOC130013235 [Patella vulgata]|uniref:uncharacterized protein LOC130013235 n=1 Tax=Patella vulgata TaxID=6465 RepID=UPI0024A923F7|nr:uncharacterized protein LOC130013235 [Patella vulgata]